MENNKYREIVIFAGTTEGRQLSERLSMAKVCHTVCVATDYGEYIQNKNEFVKVHKGRLDISQMTTFLKDNTRFVFDATHPYATEVTDNIKQAVKQLGTEYYRVIRKSESGSCEAEDIETFDDALSCAKRLGKEKGNILITTGSKEIKIIADNIADKERLYVRIIPSVSSIELCLEAGIRNEHIIAMQGPFSKETNLALINQYKINCLVTKESGKAGGFSEKILAAKEGNCKCFVIKRPADESGISVEKAADIVFDGYGVCSVTCQKINLSIIGKGMGTLAGMTVLATSAIRKADAVFGASRVIVDLSDITNARLYPHYLAEDIIRELENNRIENAAIIFSGDTGFYSGAARFRDKIRKWAGNNNIKISIQEYPGISSLSYLSAKTGTDYSDVKIISLHGNNNDRQLENAAITVMHNEIVFSLLSGVSDIYRLACLLVNRGINASFIIGNRLSYDDEMIVELMASDIVNQTSKLSFGDKDLCCVLIKNENPVPELLISYFDDNDFIRDKVPMTKGVIRHESVRLLKICARQVVYDIGAGTGSVALEIAGLSGLVKVIAIEKNEAAVRLIESNSKKLGLCNLEIIKGQAPDIFNESIFQDIPEPSCVFIGGSSGKLLDILERVSKMTDSFRCVITAGTLETIGQISELNKNSKVKNLEIIQINHSIMKEIGHYQLMDAQNPVIICAFDYVSNENA